MNEQVKPWANFGYEPVGAAVNKLLARYLRTQRKNMLRFFEGRGLFDFANRLKSIRKSNQDMLTKNRRFQQVLNDYAKTSTSPSLSRDVPGNVLREPPPVIEGETG